MTAALPPREGRSGQPTHICLDCGAVGYAGGYHDHGDGNAGDTAAIKDVLAQLRRGGRAIDTLEQALADLDQHDRRHSNQELRDLVDDFLEAGREAVAPDGVAHA
jgi:hypothetical protein